ncbi:MAG: glycolate oxidase subunit GlcE [Rhodocyclaceae bacterium]|jgi:glycolate oxidase FAD binding subunit|nr:glycolate oxidase subunit GlcE [Rhodocyclaceae bacterium]MCL4759213.1 glycolate oxidase subunit GlcE [Rhodocyclaceae bacterium]
MSELVRQWQERVRAAAADGESLQLRGGGTKDFYGRRVSGTVLDTRAHRGVSAYEPTELVVSARAGTPLAELEQLLADRGQMLAFEPPHFGAAATVGGCVAAGLSGPRRLAAGPLRDYVLGVTVMDGRGEVLRFGGQVMKNVAGYDVSRLFAGSLGVFGILLEVSLKVLPVPFAERSLRFDCGESDAIRRLNDWGGQPLPLSASFWYGGVLTVRLSGAAAAVQAASAKLGGEPCDEAEAARFWLAVREQACAPLAQETAQPGGPTQPLWRIAVPSAAPALELTGRQCIEWGGGLRWLRTELPAQAVRERAHALGGHASLFAGGDRESEVFHPLPQASMAIHRRLKQAFDPAGVFNPGRLQDGL